MIQFLLFNIANDPTLIKSASPLLMRLIHSVVYNLHPFVVMASETAGVLLLLLAVSAAFSFPTGAPDRACDSMEPQHDSQPQQTAFPYSILCIQTAPDRVTGEFNRLNAVLVCEDSA